MGASSSTTQNPSDQNSRSTNSPSSSNMFSSDSPNLQKPDPKTLDSQNPDPKTPNNQNPEKSDQLNNPDEKGSISEEQKEIGEEEEQEEEGECGFCLFMKGGGCKEAFVAWEECVEEAEKNKEDIVEKCFQITDNLKKCMEAHSDYYEPILRAEKAAENEVKQELEAEKKSEETNAGSKKVEERAEIEVQKEG